jgi:hypothetical protein
MQRADTASPPPSTQERTIYQVGEVFHYPLADYYKTAILKWKKGVKVIQEDPPQSYLDQFNIFPGIWSSNNWGKWYRLLDADGSQYLDYYILSDKEVEEI